MKFITYGFVLLVFICNFKAVGQKNAVLWGVAKKFNNEIPIYDKSELEALKLGAETSFVPDSNGKYDVSLFVERPCYFKVGRNILYIAPGDSIYADLNYEWPDSAMFKGSHHIENNYLRSTPFPKAGSFLEAGKNIKPTVHETIDAILHAAIVRNKRLNSYAKIATEFKMLETARIRADIINSLYKIYTYFPFVNKLKKDSLELFQAAANKEIEPYIKQYSKNFLNIAFLQLEVYRDIVPLILLHDSADKKASFNINDWIKATHLLHGIQTTNERSSAFDFGVQIKEIKSERYKNILKNSYQRLRTYNGDKASDFMMIDKEGDSTNLSEFKGRVIYIDIWATWCGPCFKELPYLDTLREFFAKNNEVVLISLSIDGDIEKWQEKIRLKNMVGHQYRIDREELNVYYISEIPRTIIIDKNFNIAALRGPQPSAKETTGILSRLSEK